jgi:hypothetical protein
MSRSVFDIAHGWFDRVVLAHRWATFIVMGLAFFVFGAGTVNLFMLFRTNVELVSEYGWQALEDGAFAQFVELFVTGYVSMLAYVVFKACESKLVRDLLTSSVQRSETGCEATAPDARPEDKPLSAQRDP